MALALPAGMKTTYATSDYLAPARNPLRSVPMPDARVPREPVAATEGLFAAILDSSDVGVVVLDRLCRPCYLNPCARRLLSAASELPEDLQSQLQPMLARVSVTGKHVVTRCLLDDLVLRARLRPLGDRRGLIVLELSVARATRSVDIVVALSRSLQLSRANAELLSLLWRGLRNHEIAAEQSVPIGTIKSRLYRLYQRLGVRSRSAAVLAAAEVLGSA